MTARLTRTQEMSHETIWGFAVGAKAIIVTKDEDFAWRRGMGGKGSGGDMGQGAEYAAAGDADMVRKCVGGCPDGVATRGDAGWGELTCTLIK